MKRFMILSLLLGLPISGATATAQPAWPNAAVYAVANLGELTPPNRLMGFSDTGALLYDFVVPNALGLDSICMNKTNDGFVIGDDNGFHRIPLAGGGSAFQALPGGKIIWVDVDENGGLVWCTSNLGSGEIWRQPPGGAAVMLRSTPGILYNAVAWNGSTGGYVAVEYDTTAAAGRAQFVDRNGVITLTVPGISHMSGVDWDPRTGEMIISRFGNTVAPNASLVRVTQAGAVTAVVPLTAPVDAANSVEVFENPLPGLTTAGGRYIGVEYGLSPRHIYRKTTGAAAATPIYTSNTFGPADLELTRSRQVWGLNRWSPGGIGRLSVNFGPGFAGHAYLVALSFGHLPGIALGAAGHLHLNPDVLFALSVFCPGAPFNNFCGVLDARGRAPVNPTVNLPVVGPLRIYAGAVAIGPAGISGVSNCYGVNID